MAERISVRKTRRLRVLLAKHYKLPEPPDPQDDCLGRVVMTVLWEDTPPERARIAYVNLAEEYVDWNELRVSVTSDVAAVLESCGLPGRKGAIVKRVLGRAVEELFSFDFDELRRLSRERLKAWFMGIEGVPHGTAAEILYHVYDYDRLLVDADIARVIRRLGLVSETATEADIEAGLNDVMPARDAYLNYNALRQHARTVCTKKDFECAKCPLRGECVTGKRVLAERKAAAKAARKEAREAAKQEAKAKAATKRKAKRKARAKKTAKAAGKSRTKAKPSTKTPTRRRRPTRK